MSVMDMDYDKLPADTVEALEYIKRLMCEPWEQGAQERGLGAVKDFGKDNPLTALQGSMEDLVSGAVYSFSLSTPKTPPPFSLSLTSPTRISTARRMRCCTPLWA